MGFLKITLSVYIEYFEVKQESNYLIGIDIKR